jgi:hypothetical protein
MHGAAATAEHVFHGAGVAIARGVSAAGWGRPVDAA